MDTPTKSTSDYRDYRIVVLDNGIKVLLISDINPNKSHQNGDVTQETGGGEEENILAAAALCVAAGSFDEPVDVPGLAHFLEHMVFMGSDKYPEENGYDSYLNMHGGSNNAYTCEETTVFYFDVQPENFEGALDRFAQFFISPLLRDDAVDREVKAVDSEFKGRLPDDDCRSDEVLRRFASDRHPFSRFTHGNKKSLVTIPKEKGIDVMGRLRVFFRTEYCTKQMTLSLCSPIPLDELETMARKYFSDIPTRDNVKLLHNVELDNPYEMDQFHKLIYIYPVEEVHLIEFTWLMRPLHRHYRTKPGYYISWLLNDRCQGSVYSCLKQKGYLCSVSAYHSAQCTSFSRFSCSIELTEKGLDNIVEVVHTLFQYISMLQRNGASKEIYNQLQRISDQCFRYEEPDEPYDVVEDVVDSMQYYDDEDYLSGASLLREYDPNLIEEIQNCLTTDSVNISVQSKKFHSICKTVEPWFKAKYTVKDIPSKWLDKSKCTAANPKLHLPKQNPYISNNFELHKIDHSLCFDYPIVVEDSPHGKVWYKPDRKFLLPKSDISFMLVTPVPQRSQFHLLSSAMLERVLDFELEELLHEAGVASLNLCQKSATNCHTITVTGFSDKILALLKDAMKLFSSFHFTENGFNVSKEELERDLRNALIRSEELNGTLKGLIMCNIMANPIEGLKELVEFTPASLKDYYSEYFSQLYVESLFQGNVSKEQAESLQACVYNAFQNKVLPRDQFPEMRTLCLPKGRTLCRHNGFSKKDPNSVIHNYYEVGRPTLRLLITSAVLEHVMSEPLFDSLRTKQQLGYSVYCTAELSEGGILGYSITVETDSDKFTADDIDSKITDFLKGFYKKLEEEEGYDNYVSSYIKSLRRADLSVSDEVNRNWSEIYHGNYIFDRRRRKIALAKQISKSEVLDFLEKYLLDDANVKMLSVQVIGHPEDDGEEDGESSMGSEEESDSEDGYSSSSSDEEHEEEMENLRHREIKLVDVESPQYTRTIKDINKFREENMFYPVTRLELE